jgi:cell division septation protein DedD
MPAWERTAQDAPAAEAPTASLRCPDVASAKPEAGAVAAEPPPKSKPTRRRFADPLAEDDDGANCLRCGYLVEAARDRRGLRTCAACG